MGNVSVKINLSALDCAVQKMKGKTGDVEVLVIPIDKNHLYRGEKGFYLDLQCIELKEKKADRKDTHLVKQSLPKEVYSAMSDEDKKAQPILGNAIVWGESSGSTTVAPKSIEEGEDLPW